MKKILFLIILLLIPSVLWAECSGSSPNLTAASANYTDVKACTDIATYGDTVNIPACANGDCVWTSGIDLTKDIKIKGAGKTSTYIVNGTIPSAPVYSYIFKFTPDETSRNRLDSLTGDTAIFEISGIAFTSTTFDNYDYRGHLCLRNDLLPVVRRVSIHDNSFTNTYAPAIGDGGYMYGVIYKNDFVNSRGPKVGGAGAGGFINDRMALGDGKGWYIEDNTYTMSYPNTMIASGTNNGGGWVARYNTATGTTWGGTTAFESHGNQIGIYGPQKTEIYGNSINVSQYSVLHDARGGKNAIYYNKHSNDDVNDIQVREEFSDFASGTALNDYLCADNTGEVQTCTSSCICQKVHDSYFWNNRKYSTNAVIGVGKGSDYDCQAASTTCTAKYGAGYSYPAINSPLELVKDREYFDFVPTGFDGTTGVGCGTAATLAAQTTCTKGVAFWVPNATIDPNAASCANPSSFTGTEEGQSLVGANNTLAASVNGKIGKLYRCVSNNTWDSGSYEPYTYPHPLRDDGGSDTTAPTFSTASINTAGTTLTIELTEDVTVNTNTGFAITCSGGAATLTYVSESSGDLTYTISRAIQQTEGNCTLAYTTGANYIEDAAGNDLGNLADKVVVNGSTQNTPPLVELTITATGARGIVTPAGTNASIYCGSTCAATYDNGTVATLQGYCLANYQNMVIGGACNASTGNVTMSEARACTITCTKIAADNKVGTGTPGHKVGAGNPAHKRY